MLQRTGAIFQTAVEQEDFVKALGEPSAAPLRNFSKDLDFVLEEAERANLKLPSTLASRKAVRIAEGMNIDHVDWAYTSLMHDVAPAFSCQSESDASVFGESDLDGTVFHSLSELNASVPPSRLKEGAGYLMQCGVLAGRSGAPLVVIDDDPTGSQTVHSVPVLWDWSVETLQKALAEDIPCFYILSNTKSLVEHVAIARAEEIASNLRVAACRLGLDPAKLAVLSRDSLVRGHYPAETSAIARGMEEIFFSTSALQASVDVCGTEE